MKTSEAENDVICIVQDLLGRNLKPPSNIDILKVIFSKLIVVYTMQILFIISDILMNTASSGYHYYDSILLAAGSNVFFSVAFLMSAYNVVSLRIALDDDLMNKYSFLRMIEKKIKNYGYFLLLINFGFGVFLISEGERFVSGLGFSWFATFIICVICLQTSLSRYMTPAVLKSLSELKAKLSASND